MKVHAACGPKILKGFINIDIRKLAGVDIVCPAHELSFDDATVSLIYMCHGMEHYTFEGTHKLLDEYNRVLQRGGMLCLSVPDMKQLARMYVTYNIPLKTIQYAVCGGQDYPENIHYSVWDLSTITTLLAKHGFANIQRVPSFKFVPAHFDWSTGKIAGHLISLNVVAVKT